jgi:NAD(P)-dependent dehydrogenase (short-subunit alcohol dehydrogenase family)
LKLDKKLGHDLSDEKFVADWFAKNKDLYGMIVSHAFNPVPAKNTKKVEPIDVPLAELRDYLELNTVSAFDVARNFIKNNKGGAIINISSLYGHKSPKHFIYQNFNKPIAYGASKAALVNMTKYLGTYYAPDFRINTVVIGGIKDPNQDPHFIKHFSANTAMGKQMDLHEIIPAFEFLLDENNNHTIATEIYVDGGWTAW